MLPCETFACAGLAPVIKVLARRLPAISLCAVLKFRWLFMRFAGCLGCKVRGLVCQGGFSSALSFLLAESLCCDLDHLFQ